MGAKGQRKSNRSKHTDKLRLLMLTAGPSGPSHTETHRHTVSNTHSSISVVVSAFSPRLEKQTTQHDTRRRREGNNVCQQAEDEASETSKEVILRSLTGNTRTNTGKMETDRETLADNIKS